MPTTDTELRETRRKGPSRQSAPKLTLRVAAAAPGSIPTAPASGELRPEQERSSRSERASGMQVFNADAAFTLWVYRTACSATRPQRRAARAWGLTERAAPTITTDKALETA